MKSFLTFSLGMLAGCFLAIAAISFAANESPVDVNELRRLTESFQILKANHLDAPTDRRLVDGCITGMAQGLDAASVYVDRETWREMQNGKAGLLGGTGLEIRLEDGFAAVVAPMDGSPAARAGVRPNDLIVMIDGKDARNLPLQEVVRRLRGDIGSEVILLIARQGTKGLMSIAMRREAIRLESAKLRMLDDGVAVVRLPTLHDSTVEQLVEQIRGASSPLNGIVLDLRNNAGGTVGAALGVASVFLKPSAKVVAFEGNVRDGISSLSAVPEDYRSPGWKTDFLQTLPAGVKKVRMIVLVNRGTAAGAEIVGAALQDNRRAIIVGTQTLGSTTIQTFFPLKDEDGLKVTTARWITPNGRSLASKGLAPDVNVDGSDERASDANASDPQLDVALRMIRSR